VELTGVFRNRAALSQLVVPLLGQEVLHVTVGLHATRGIGGATKVRDVGRASHEVLSRQSVLSHVVLGDARGDGHALKCGDHAADLLVAGVLVHGAEGRGKFTVTVERHRSNLTDGGTVIKLHVDEVRVVALLVEHTAVLKLDDLNGVVAGAGGQVASADGLAGICGNVEHDESLRMGLL